MEVMREFGRRDGIWIKHYSSQHNILLVGDGDFSFSRCLATAFGSAANIVATSLDSYGELITKYKNANANLMVLKTLGASIIHEVDATQMSGLSCFQGAKFHRIIYNFPHAGFYGSENHPDLIRMHRNLVRGFLTNARQMLCIDGQIHINHKITAPFDSWGIKDLAPECSLLFIGQDIFRSEDYPGYENKRGSGSRSDEAFPLGECSTFMFKQIPVRQTYNNDILLQAECRRIFGRYLRHVGETFGRTYDVGNTLREVMREGFEMYMNVAPPRHSSGYIGVLEELYQMSISRSRNLRETLLQLDRQG